MILLPEIPHIRFLKQLSEKLVVMLGLHVLLNVEMIIIGILFGELQNDGKLQ
jgi:hypothetical protein